MKYDLTPIIILELLLSLDPGIEVTLRNTSFEVTCPERAAEECRILLNFYQMLDKESDFYWLEVK